MCGPAAIVAGASMALKIGSDIAAGHAKNEQAAANRRAALRSFQNQITDIGTTESQLQQAESLNIFDLHRSARASLAMERISQGESGVAGTSAQAVRADIAAKAAEASRRSEKTAKQKMGGLERQKSAAFDVFKSRLEGAKGVNPWAMGLKIGGDVLSSFGSYSSMKGSEPSTSTSS